MIESIEERACDVKELDALQKRLQKNLSGKKFLLVLDDVWDNVLDKWSSLKELLRCGAKGSVVLITTRIEMAALRMESIFSQHVERLSEDDSCLLFQRFAFGMERREEHVKWEAIGREIVSKCCGVPLAIKSLGKLMYLKKTEREWLSIKNSEIWDLQEDEKEILPALRLSYTNLPPNLKRCFAFCSIFPKDHVIKRDWLIALWMANGFISGKGPMDFLDKGQKVFTELVGRSFFQEVKEDELGNIACKMHDLMHDLAQSIMIDECCLVEGNNEPGISKTVRHMAFWEGYGDFSHHKCLNIQSFRLLHFQSANPSFKGGNKFLSLCCSRQKHLRVLDISGFYDVEKVSQSICNLKLLRDLDVSGSSIKKLPESITSILNLQTLNLKGCSELRKLPEGMKDMKNLMYLDISGCVSLGYMPAGMGQLTCLQKLSLFIVGNDNGRHIRELERLNHLGDELRIINIGNVKDLTDAKSANLMQKANLQSLTLSWYRKGFCLSETLHWLLCAFKSNVIRENIEGVLDGLQPHPNLKKLRICGYGGSEFPKWMMELQLPNLVEISLVACSNWEKLPPFGKLKFLKRLYLVGMDGVECIIGNDVFGDDHEENPFPTLDTLNLYSMTSLKVWATVTTDRVCFPVLNRLHVENCPVLDEMPVMPFLRTLEINHSSVTFLRSLTSLSILEINNIPNLKILPDGLLQNHTHLERLTISGLRDLESLSNQIFDNLSSLRILQIHGCPELENFTDEGLSNLSSLETLSIQRSDRLQSLPTNGLCGLSSLRKLSICYCKKFVSLSEGVQNLTALDELELTGCPELNSLPESIQHLTSLQSPPNQIRCLTSLSTLKIGDCPNLKSLPDEIQSLNALKQLLIKGCPELEKRCVRDRGEDWPKIAHIPNIQIKGKVIQGPPQT